jgi:L-asparaginase/Glu-tRNA(Gln) amidotransferase subunit D
MNDRILLIRAGGTMDSQRYGDLRNPPKYVETLKGRDSLVMPTVQKLDSQQRVDEFTWLARDDEDRFVKDSQKFTLRDINALANIIKQDNHRLVVITHGTDGMAHNATLLQRALQGTDKVVVFTGAMVPLSMQDKHESDALAALQYALDHIDSQHASVTMVARDAHTKRLGFHDPQTVQKEKETSLDDLIFTVSNKEKQTHSR